MYISQLYYTCTSCDWLACAGCYGVPEEDVEDEGRSDLSSFTTVPWFCDACKAGVDPVKCVSFHHSCSFSSRAYVHVK